MRSSTGEVTLERRAEADMGEVLDVLAAVFADTQRAWFEAGRCDPPYPQSVGFIARADGRIVSHVELLDMPVRYGEAIVHVAAVSGVATLPEWRGRGLASTLMEQAIAEMAARDMPLSLLLTGSQAFYERLGWSDWPPPGCAIGWADAPEMAAHLSTPAQVSVAAYRPGDLPEMMALYERFNASRPGALVRPERYWRSLLVRWLEATEYPGQRNAVYVARREGRLVGYGFAFSNEDALVLAEMAYDDMDAVGPLLKALVAGMGGAERRRLVAVLPWDNAALGLLQASRRSALIEPMGIMWRINDLVGLLQQVKPVLERRLASAPALPLRGERGVGLVLSYERGGVVLEAQQGRLEMRQASAHTGLPYCHLSQADLVSLLLGSYASPGWLDGLELPDEARPLVETLFPPAGGIFWLTDNF
jgi:predicted N-acetyltransferase YhbS